MSPPANLVSGHSLSQRSSVPLPIQTIAAMIWERFQNLGKLVLCILICLTLAYLYFFSIPAILTRPVAAPVLPSLPEVNSAILIFHAFTAIPPLATGILLFSKRLRNKSLKLHRWAGTIYCLCIWASATTGILLAMANTRGPVAQAGFGLLGFAWFATTWYAYKFGRMRNIALHRIWMIRSYALTLAVVSVRPMFIFGPGFGFSAEAWYLLVTWLCWVPNLMAAELYIALTRNNGRLKFA